MLKLFPSKINLTERLQAAENLQALERAALAAPAEQVKSFTGANYSVGGTWGTWPNAMFNRSINPQRAAGNPLENSLVFGGLDWQATAFQEAPFMVKGLNDTGAEEIVFGHPLAKLIKRPNPYWSRSRFWRATLLSRFLNGNSYWLKVRSAAGIVVEMWWLPHYAVRPVVEHGQIIRYEYRANGEVYHYAPEDIVHFRYGVDPDNPLMGFAPFRAMVRSLATDNEAAAYEAIILHNMGVPAPVISPKSDQDEISPADGEKIRATWVARTSGGERGMPVVLPVPLDVQSVALSPNDFALEHVHDHVESRMAMVMKIPPVVLGVLVGLKHSTAKASYNDSARIAWRQNIIPTQEEFTEEIDTYLLGDYGLGNPDNEFSAFDTSNVEVLQEDREALSKRTTNEFKSKVCDRSEARSRLGYKARPEDENVWFDGNAGATAPGAADDIEKTGDDGEKQDEDA